jgi:FkbM family methyltransferase
MALLKTAKSLTLKQLKKRGYRLVNRRDPFDEQGRLLRAETPRVIFDIGANRGETVCAYRQVFPKATIYAFEPLPELAAGLRRRFKQDPDIHVIEAAVGRHHGNALLNISSGMSTHSLLVRPRDGLQYLPERATIVGQANVDVISLDEFCATRGLSVIDIVKVDVEGSELQVLEGSHQLLDRTGITLMLLEVMFVPHYADQPLYFAIASLLNRYGYGIYDLYDMRRSRRNGQLRYANALFVSPTFRRQAL